MCRKRRGIKQVDLAAAMGADYTQSTLAHVERGSRGISLERLIGAAIELGVSLDYLAGLTDDPTPAPARSVRPFLAQAEALPEPRRTLALTQIARAEGRESPPMSPERLKLFDQERQFAEGVSYLLGLEQQLLDGMDTEIDRARSRLPDTRCPVARRNFGALGDAIRHLRDWSAAHHPFDPHDRRTR